jgi:hypothetical protein
LRGLPKRPKSPISEAEHERGQRVDAAKQRELRDGRQPLALERESREPLVERGLAASQAVDGGERVEVGELGGGLVELLPGKPVTMTLRPRTRLRGDTPVQQQQLRDAVPAAHQVGPNLLTSTAEMPRGLDARAGHGDDLQLTGEQQPGQELGVLAVALDPVAGRAGVGLGTITPTRSRTPSSTVEREAGRAGFGSHAGVVAACSGRSPLAAAADASAAELAARNVDGGGMGRAGVDIQAHVGHRCGHGRTLLPLHGVSRSESPARQTPDL